MPNGISPRPGRSGKPTTGQDEIKEDIMENLKCDQCGRWLPAVYFVETIEEYLCEDCASGAFDVYTEDPEPDWDGVIPINGEVSPDECANYPTHPAMMAADEANDPSSPARLRAAYEAFEALVGSGEWQPSAEAKKLIQELNG